MRKCSVFFMVILTVVLLASCSEEVGTTSLKLVLKSDSMSRLITNQSVDINYFQVLGTGPADKTGTVQVVEEKVYIPKTSVNLDGLLIGNWTFKVTAYNEQNTPLMEGSSVVYISSRPSPITIDVNDPVGKGNIELSISWQAPQVEDPSLKVYLRGPSMDSSETCNTEPIIDKTNGTATYTVNQLVSGSYVVRTELYDGTSLYGGKVETVKVFKDSTTTGSISIVYDSNASLKETSLTLQTVYGRPVQGNVLPSGRNDHVLYTSETSVLNFSVSSTTTINDSDYTVEWYYDGIKQTSGTTQLSSNVSTFTFTPYVGVHIVDVVCYNKNYASVGCAEWSFTAVTRGPAGSLFIQREVRDGENGVNLGLGTLIGGIPGGKFLVLSPVSHLLQVCDLNNDGIKVHSTLSNEWFSYAEHLYSDYRMNNFAVIDNQNSTSTPQENFTLFKYTSDTSTPQLSVMRDSDQAVMRYYKHGEIFAAKDIASAAFYPTGNGDGFIFLNDCKTSNAPLSMFQFINGEAQKPKAQVKQNSKGSLSKSCSFGSSSRMFYTLPGNSAVAYDVFDKTTPGFSGAGTSVEIPIRFDASYVCAISDVEFAVSDGTSQTCIYISQASSWEVTSIKYHPTSKICVAPNGYIYMLDKVNSTIYAYSISNTGTLTELNRISAENLTDIVYSDGTLLASTSDGKLLFCKVVTK